MAPHLLHWEIIRQAKQLGYHFYDFWGIDEKKWPGLTRFKKGFGGKIIEYPGTFDLVFNKFWYQLYRLGKIFKNF
jgi:lipid II:glycine glycyltransferase (peptidoglycan interpeptide bridge formation enzyme)